jgi:putative transposase
VFVDRATVDPITAQLFQSADQERFAVIAYCFMPDHLHALIEGLNDTADMRGLVHRWKQVSGYAWKRRTGVHLWQRGYFERTLRQDDDAVAVVRYVIANPLRAHLVESVLDYPFVGSQVMELKDLIHSVAGGRV